MIKLLKELSKTKLIIWPNGEVINLKEYLIEKLNKGVRLNDFEFLVKWIKNNCDEKTL